MLSGSAEITAYEQIAAVVCLSADRLKNKPLEIIMVVSQKW